MYILYIQYIHYCIALKARSYNLKRRTSFFRTFISSSSRASRYLLPSSHLILHIYIHIYILIYRERGESINEREERLNYKDIYIYLYIYYYLF